MKRFYHELSRSQTSMEIVHRTAVVPYTPQEVFELVNDIESYPDFLPWCVHAFIEEETGQGVIASLTLEKGGIRKRFTTRNEIVPGEKLEMHLVEGPFKHLYGVWTLQPHQSGCEVTVSLEFDFSSRIIAMLIGPVFQHAANTLLDSFIARAHQVYGEGHAN